jgi:DNA polymerase-3 subunit gamma/tau
MSYQVLARKWRPAKFAELVGQQHVKDALINGLSNQRLHHAYLFTGTRGVGKTTIARIFAKSLNCETGVTSEPCGQCSTCIDVDQGRFVDLIEIDAASRTKVSDTREILDNVQYSPTRGRYKVYLIDEVHMLSRHSFNALLKTLEEPPEHVKFLLATTDPQKLPVTILSRCLQFNLQALTVEQIQQQLTFILQHESIQFDVAALELLARSARGSMRDALSLTDQAIAQSDLNVTLPIVQQMLGTVDSEWSEQLLGAILEGSSEQLVNAFEKLRLQQPDAGRVLDDLIDLTHQIALAQVISSAEKLAVRHVQFINRIKSALSPETVQVYYHFLLQGKKELPLLSDQLSGLEMVCLRLLAFKPSSQFKEIDTTSQLTHQPEAVKKNAEEQLEIAGTETIDNELHQESSQGSIQNEVEKLQAQEAFYHDMAVSQGFDSVQTSQENVAPLHNETDTSNQDVGESALPAESTDTHDSYADYAASIDGNLAPTPSQTEAVVTATNQEQVQKSHSSETTVEGGRALFSSSAEDNPVLAILAARSADQQPIKNELQEKNQDENVVESEPQIQVPQEEELKAIDSHDVRFAHEVDPWASLIERSGIAGLSRQLALNSAVDMQDETIELTVKQEFAHLLNERSEQELRNVVEVLAPNQEFIINKSQLIEQSPAAIQVEINENRQQRAEQNIQQDPLVQSIISDFDGKIIPESIKPL